MSVPALLGACVAWCRTLPDVQAVCLVGSHARGRATADSDVDLVVLTSSPERYVADETWAGRFGRVVRRVVEDWGRVTSVRIWYAAGLEVEFGFATPDWVGQPLDEGTREVLGAGHRALLDPDGLFDGLPGIRPES